ncbi:sulfatase family protein [Nocardioides jejuensis]|uniref:Sulfatase N-terminal domain-containing protein n=1 Tax=Nocardioides jejuensis TaxID=2502782 RepID=A0A4R1CGL0_9ACTN|nr:sulfatase [Nocardioides jejuensis]TCJ30484.1 hypothetical protein EPD65_02605 [Nocardioides jejuensis]
MKRRSTLISLVAALAVAVPTFGAINHETSAGAAVARTGAPNVLVVMTDDMRYDDVKYMPNLRKFLGARGTDFRNMFAPTPLCCPNRASFLTGKYAHNHHVWWHDEPWGYGAFDDRHTIGGALQAAGYTTGYVGKYLNGYGRMRPKADPTHKPSTYVPAGWDEWRGTPDATSLPESDPRAGSTYRYFDTTVNENGKLVGHQGVYNSRLLVSEGVKLIDKFHGSSKPWYLMINSLAPHHGGPVEKDDPYLVTPARPTWVKGKFNQQIQRGPGVPRSGEPEADVSDKARITRSKEPFGKRERNAVRNEARQRAETLYVLDKQLQRVWDELARAGQLRNTVIAFTSDNGYMEGEHRWQAGKLIGFDSSYRVPLLVAGPGIPAGARQYSPVTTIDLTASILDWTGAHLPGVDGRSFVPDIGTKVGWNRAVGYEAHIPNIRNKQKTIFTDARQAIGIRTGRYFYVRYANGQSELFDLEKDPLELKSVTADPAYAAAKRELNVAWKAFKDCRGEACVVALPPNLRTNAAQDASIREGLTTATARYYG